jgi:ribosomal protein S14
MDVMDRVANVLLGSRGNTYCSSCLAASLAVATEHEVQRVVTALSDSASFSGTSNRCSLCGRDRIVICSNRSASSRLDIMGV